MDYLVLDIGNYLTKWGICSTYKDGQRCWHRTGSALTGDFDHLKNEWPCQHYTLEKAVFSNVVYSPDELQKLVSLVQKEWHLEPKPMVPSSESCGLKNLYVGPSQLGSDRWASAVAAHLLFPGQLLLIINCGTALTVDVVAQRSFHGGIIGPGFHIARTVLMNSTKISCRVDNEFKVDMQSIPKDTLSAVDLGCCDLILGCVRRMFDRVTSQFNQEPRIVASGGSGHLFCQLWRESFSLSASYIDTLVLDGLVFLSESSLC